MTKYMNKQNGKVMEIVKEAEDGRAMIIKFEDGKTSSITTGTFKRWYKAFEVPETVETLDVEPDVENALTEDEALEQAVVDPEEAYVREVMEQKKELGIECPEITGFEEVAGDGTPLAQVGKEIAEQAKQKAAKASKAAKKPVVDSEACKTFMNKLQSRAEKLGCELTIGASGTACSRIKYGKATVLEIYTRKNGYAFYAKPFIESMVTGYTYNLVKYNLSVVVKGIDFSNDLVFDVLEKTISVITEEKTNK